MPSTLAQFALLRLHFYVTWVYKQFVKLLSYDIIKNAFLFECILKLLLKDNGVIMDHSQKELISLSSKERMLARLAARKSAMYGDENQTGASLFNIPEWLKNTVWNVSLKTFSKDSIIKFTNDRFIINLVCPPDSAAIIGYVYLDSADAVGDISEPKIGEGRYEVKFSTNKNKDVWILFAFEKDPFSGDLIIKFSNGISFIFALIKPT